MTQPINFEAFKNIITYWHTAGMMALAECGHPECATRILLESLQKEYPDSSEHIIHGLAAMTMAFTLLGIASPENRNEIQAIISGTNMEDQSRRGYL